MRTSLRAVSPVSRILWNLDGSSDAKWTLRGVEKFDSGARFWRFARTLNGHYGTLTLYVGAVVSGASSRLVVLYRRGALACQYPSRLPARGRGRPRPA